MIAVFVLVASLSMFSFGNTQSTETDPVKLKQQIEQLQRENQLLRSLLTQAQAPTPTPQQHNATPAPEDAASKFDSAALTTATTRLRSVGLSGENLSDVLRQLQTVATITRKNSPAWHFDIVALAGLYVEIQRSGHITEQQVHGLRQQGFDITPELQRATPYKTEIAFGLMLLNDGVTEKQFNTALRRATAKRNRE